MSPSAIWDLRFAIAFNRKSAIANPQSSALLLLVFGVGADHAHDAFAAHDLAVLTNSLDARSHFHETPSALEKTRDAGGIHLYRRKI
jgi:hypothetical protein